MGKRRNSRPLFYNFNRPHRQGTYYERPDRVKDPKTAFYWLLDNIAGQNSGKLLEDKAARGEYYWVERDRQPDMSYYIVRKRGNHVIVLQRKWVVKGEGVNTFIGMLTGYDEKPIRVDKIVLRHPIMEFETFAKAYAEATPLLHHWSD